MAHIYHLHENLLLTFGEIKDVLKKVYKNEIKVFEKTDGQNILLSYSVNKKKALCARTKNDIVSGGLLISELVERFSNQTVKDTFIAAFKEWERAISLLPKMSATEIFGHDANIFYNCEIQNPENKNVINYDAKYIVIHSNGHLEFDRQNNNFISRNLSYNVDILDKSLKQIESSMADFNYKLISKNVYNLKTKFDESRLKYYTAQLNNLMDEFGLEDSDNIKILCVKSIAIKIEEEFPELTEYIKQEIVKKMCGIYTNFDIKIATKSLGKNGSNKLKRFMADSDVIIKDATEKLEQIIHDFSVELLSGLRSLFILDNDKEVKRLRAELEKAIERIKNSGDPNAISVLYKQLKKLKAVDKLDTAVEGLVFDYGGKTYKFTGNFAPINQILGMLTYNKVNFRGNIEFSRSGNIGIFPGKFKPPHLGHFMGVKELSKYQGIEKVMVIISSKEQDGITAEMSKEIWEIYKKYEPKIEAIISKEISPINATYEELKTVDSNKKVFLTLSHKELESGNYRFKDVKKYVDKYNPGLQVEVLYTLQNDEGIDGTYVRKLIINGDKEMFFATLPKEVIKSDKEKIWEIVNNKLFVANSDIENIVKESLKQVIFRR
jgi:hypothetical protein